jgi:hypothetical protein
MPELDHFLAQVVAEGIDHIPVTVTAGKNYYAEFHGSLFVGNAKLLLNREGAKEGCEMREIRCRIPDTGYEA